MSKFKNLLKNVPAMASVVSEKKSSAEFAGFIDSGSYTVNAALSGSLFGGFPDNKVSVLAGESTTGKTFFVLGVLANWMKMNPTGVVVYADTESAVTDDMMRDRGIDTDRVIKLEPDTIEQFKVSVVALLDNYEADPEKYPLFAVLDSLGNLSSAKEMQDAKDQKDTRDMTKAGAIRGTFRVLRLKMSKLRVPMIVTNHVYTVVGAYVPTKEMSGGMGLKYISDGILFLSKSKERDSEKRVIGNTIKVTVAKSRLSVENSQVETKILYSGGLDRYAGLLDMALDSGLVKKVGNKIQFPNESPAFESVINKNPEKYFTSEFLQTLDEWVQKTYKYTGNVDEELLDVTEFDEVDA